eukprot:Seg3902.2 transcript_id=Seg3902.2/GoldUCD/mRNA.D3Y31 product="hypothetical protein" protein_id=Seg3902.2/GoldUCD/D3Y31
MELTAEDKAYLYKQFDTLLQPLAKKEDITSLKEEVTLLVTEKIQEQEKKISSLEERINELEANNVILESHVSHLRKSYENQEQYSRCLCLRIDGIDLPPKGTNETGETVLGKVNDIFDELEVDVPDAKDLCAAVTAPGPSRRGGGGGY